MLPIIIRRSTRRGVGRIAIVSASLGAGHDGAAHEIARRLQDIGHEVECHDFLYLLPLRLGRRVREAYRQQLNTVPQSWEWLLTMLHRHPVFASFVIWLAAASSRSMRRAIGDADVVVSTYPLASQVIVRMRRRGSLAVPVVTYLTDPSVHSLWIAEGTDLYLAAHPEIAHQVNALGARCVSVVAPAVRPEFRPPCSAAEQARARARFGLPADGLFALVISGSWAVGEIEQSARDVAAGGIVTPVVVCGENEALRERLRDLEPGIVLGWVDDMPTLLRACDVVVQISGGLTFFEAHATGVPVLTYRCLAGHGRTNARSLESAGLARWMHNSTELDAALRKIAVRPDSNVLTAPAPDQVGKICPTTAILGLVGQPAEQPSEASLRYRRLRRLTVWLIGVTCLLWLGTNGTSMAVAHGWRAVGVSGLSSRSVYFVVDVSPDQDITQQDINTLSQLHAAVAISVTTATKDPNLVRKMARSGLLVVNSAGGRPYETGVFTGRGAIGAGAKAITALTSHTPNLMLSNGDVDAVDVGLAALYRERILVAHASIGCGASTPALPEHGGVVLVQENKGQQCSLDSMLPRLASQAAEQDLRPSALEGKPA
jgi:UDP-N-acetylglucosamine:LPS N-acetylglucosamine transferase